MLSGLNSFKFSFFFMQFFIVLKHLSSIYFTPLIINKYFKNNQKPPIRKNNREIGISCCPFGRADIRLCLFTLPCALGASCLVIKLVIQCPVWFRLCAHSSFRLTVSSVLSYGFSLLRQLYWWYGLLKILSWALINNKI